MARQFYLQLYFDVFDDPLVASLNQTYQLAFVKLLMQALRSEEPGVILLPLGALTRALGWRKPERTEALLDELEERRLIGFRKADEAIIIAPRLLPQLNSDERLPARRQKPSDSPERVKERVDRSRGKGVQTVADLDPVNAFLGAPDPTVTPPCNAPESPSETPHYSKEEISEKSTETTTTSEGGVTSSAPEEGKAVVVASSLRDALFQEGVSETIAEDLIRTRGAEQCKQHLLHWPFHKAENHPVRNPGGLLRRIIEENWPAPQSFLDAQAQQRAEAAAEARRQQAQAERDRREAQAAMEAQARSAWWEEQTAQTQAEIEAAARQRLSPNMRERLLADEAAGKQPGNVTRQALETAREAVITERMSTQGGDGPRTSQGGEA